MKKMAVVLMLAMISLAAPAYAVTPALVDNTSWAVGELNDGTMVGAAPHPVAWVFAKDGTVSAGGIWKGVWASAPDSDTLKVTIIMLQGGATDTFEVTFLTSNWFVATKNGKLYRVGKRK
jgi:hypothetical protein